MPICQLCLKEKKLIKAHIFPDFLYKYIFEEKHKLQLLSFDKTVKENHKKIQGKTIYTGEYDEDILCKDCDNEIIGKYESIGANTLSIIYNYFGLKPFKSDDKYYLRIDSLMPILRNTYFLFSQQTISKQKTTYTNFTNIDYSKFKMFLLSILFKVAISKREFSKDIIIGNQVDNLRKLLTNNQQIAELSFPIIIQSFNHIYNIPKKGILMPILIKEKNYMCVKFYIPGLLVTIFLNTIVDEQGTFSEYILKENGSIKIIHMRKKDIVGYLRDYKYFNL